MATFFIPRADDDEQAERLYQALAEFAGCPPAPRRERIAEVEFTSAGTRWTARVGEELTGCRVVRQLRRGELIERTEELRSSTRVLAVYPGDPCTVVTDAAPITGAPSEWANPFVVRPDAVVLFDGEQPSVGANPSTVK